MRTKWIWILGAAIAVFVLGDAANADHRYGGYGYAAPGYGYAAPGYGYAAPGYGYAAPGYGYGYSGFYNRTDHFHYTNPRVTTGYGFQSYSPYYAPGYHHGYGGGRVNVRYPSGGVNVGWGRGGGGVRVYSGYRGISIGW